MYISDDGISINHVEFEGCASWDKTIPQNDVDEGGNGHEIHCTSTIGSCKYGIAEAVNLIAVKVLGSNESETMANVVVGVLWTAKQASNKLAAARAEYAATRKMNHKGSVAAGNDNRDACSYFPAAAEKAITVGASTLGDDRAYFSNYSKCADVFAPGCQSAFLWSFLNFLSAINSHSFHFLFPLLPRLNESFKDQAKTISSTA